MKNCSRCKQDRERDQFYARPSALDGLDGVCKPCHRERRVTYTRKKHTRLLCMYGITLEQYNEMSEKQNHLCAICKKPEVIADKRGPRKLAVDHDHKTGKVRGLLCIRCNNGLGYFKDDLQVIENAVKYLALQTCRNER